MIDARPKTTGSLYFCLVLSLSLLSQASVTPVLAQGRAGELERLAEQRFEEDDLRTAVDLYRQAAVAEEKTDEKVRLLTNAAWVEYLSSDKPSALATLTEALELAPDYPFRGELYDEAFRGLFYDAQKNALVSRHNNAVSAIRDARSASDSGDTARARSLLHQALTLSPDLPQALFNLALVDLRESRMEDATAGFEKIVALHRAQPGERTENLVAPALANLGLLYNSRGLYTEAEDLLAQAVEADPSQSVAWTNLGISRRNLGRKEEAAEAFQRAHQLNPSDPNVLNNLSLAYMDNQDWVAAVGLLVEATRSFPDNSNLWLNLGLAQKGLGNDDGAVASLGNAQSLDPGNTKGLAATAAARLASHYFEASDPTSSLAEARKLIAWLPESAQGWVYQGLAQRALGDFAGARQSLEEATRLEPTGAELHNNLGSVYLSLKDYDKAEASFRRALEISPDFISARENLKVLAMHRKNPSAAPAVVATRPAPRQSAPPSTPPVRTAPTRTAPPPPAPAPPPRATPSSSSTPQATTPGNAPNRGHGLTFAEIDYAAMGLQGTLVQAVAPNSPAASAGILADDLIVRIDDQVVESGTKLDLYLRQQRDRSDFNLVILRGNLPRQLILRLR